jgi:hypothetical protein
MKNKNPSSQLKTANMQHISFQASFFVYMKYCFVSKYEELNNMLISYPCLTFIY